MLCSHCAQQDAMAKGLCRACYYRLRRTGSLERTYRPKGTLFCTFEGCRALHVARGLCEAHYRTVLKHGDVISPFGYGERKKHPNYETWRYQIRVKEGRVKEWDDFWEFLSDVGPRPSKAHAARRLDDSKPWGPDNFRWLETETTAADEAEYQRRWRAKNPLRSKGLGLKRQYGISIETYAEMYEHQNGKCAICGAHGTPYDSRNGRSTTLVVDHCHATKKLRKLLCPNCNKGLGCFKDSVSVLKKAILYLEAGGAG